MQGTKAYLLSVHILYQDGKESFKRFHRDLADAIEDASKHLGDSSTIVNVRLYEIAIGREIPLELAEVEVPQPPVVKQAYRVKHDR